MARFLLDPMFYCNVKMDLENTLWMTLTMKTLNLTQYMSVGRL